MDDRWLALILGALILVANVVWALVRGDYLARSYAKAELPPRLSLAWGTALVGAITLYVGSWLIPGGGAFFDPALGTGLPSSGVAIVSIGWISVLVDSRVKLLPTEITRIMTIQVLSGWLIFGFDTGFEMTQLAAPVLGAIIWALPAALGRATGNMGPGDLRLAPVLGFAVGTSSLLVAIVGIALAFVFAAAHGVYVATRTRKTGERIPFGPHLFAGAWAAWALSAIGPMLSM